MVDEIVDSDLSMSLQSQAQFSSLISLQVFDFMIEPLLWRNNPVWTAKYAGKNNGDGKPLVGAPTVFVSYSWDRSFMTVANWMLEYGKTHPGTYFWFDLFDAQVRCSFVLVHGTLRVQTRLCQSSQAHSHVLAQIDISQLLPATWWNEVFVDLVFDGPSGIKYAEYPWNSDKADELEENLEKYLPKVTFK